MAILTDYNAAPPADDGTAEAANEVKWSTIKTKLTDPLKAWIEAPDLDGNELILDADGDTSFHASTDDQIDVKIAGADDFVYVANIFRALSGSQVQTDTINETTPATGVTVDGVLLKDGGITATGDLDMGGNQITNLGGAWITPAFDAGNFTASGSMTWTVESGDVVTYAYIINGKTMVISFEIVTTTVGGTPSNELRIAIPASKVATKQMRNAINRLLDNSVVSAGMAIVDAGGTVLRILREDVANFTASTNLTGAFGQITLEIN